MADIAAIDAQGLTQLSRDFRRLSSDILRPELRKSLKAAADVVKNAAQSNAGFSSRIPGAIKSGVTQKGAYIRAGGPKAPHAGVLEGTASGKNRQHPVFATGDRSTWTWVEQQAKPYMVPALNSNVDRVAEMVADALVAAFEDIHFV